MQPKYETSLVAGDLAAIRGIVAREIGVDVSVEDIARWIKGRKRFQALSLGWADSTVVTWLRNRIGDAAFKRVAQDEDIRLVIELNCFPITYHRTDEQKQRLLRLSDTTPRPMKVARSKVSSTLLAKIQPIDETASRVANGE